MCVRIHWASPEALPGFDAEERVIRLPSHLSPQHSVTLVRAILAELAIPQPEFGALCWCGADVDMTPRIANQRRSEQVVKHGA